MSVYVELQKYIYVAWKRSHGCTVRSDVRLPSLFSFVSYSPAIVVSITVVWRCSQTSAIFKRKTTRPQDVAYLGCMWIQHWVRRIPERKAKSTVVNKITWKQNTKIFMISVLTLYSFRLLYGFKLYFTLDSWNHKNSIYEFRFPVKHNNILINSLTFHCG
jgi:hypothetical protein